MKSLEEHAKNFIKNYPKGTYKPTTTASKKRSTVKQVSSTRIPHRKKYPKIKRGTKKR